jgi:hypothetical protein
MKWTVILVIALIFVMSVAGSSFGQSGPAIRPRAQSSVAAGAQLNLTQPLLMPGSEAPDIFSAIPESDVLVYINVRRVLSDAVPRVLQGNSNALQDVKTGIDQLKAVTGVDAKEISRVVVGIRALGLAPDAQNVVVVAEGTFDAAGLVKAFRSDSPTSSNEERHGGRVLTIFRLPGAASGEKAAGAKQETPGEKQRALVQLGPGMIVAGDIEGVRRAVDAFDSAQGRADPEIVSAVNGTPDALVSVAGRIPTELLQKELLKSASVGQMKDLMAARLTQMILSIKQVHARLDMSTSGFPLLVAFTTGAPESASDLRCMTESARTVAVGGLAFSLLKSSADTSKTKPAAESPFPVRDIIHFLDGIVIKAEGNEVVMQTEINTETVRSLLRPKASAPAQVTKPSAPQ